MKPESSVQEITSSPDHRFLLGAAIVLFAGTFLLFFQTCGFDYVHFDDDLFVFENPWVKHGFTRDGVQWAFGKPDIDYWRPLSWLSHMLDVELFGLHPGGHHLVNVFWHALNAVMLLLFLTWTTARIGLAFFVAALFAWHPLHVESVAWIAERKDVLCGFFWLTSLCCYTWFARTERSRWYAGSLLCFGLGLASKPMIITLPFQLLLLDLWPLRRWRFQGGAGLAFGRLLKEKVPFFVLTLVCTVGLIQAQDSVGALKGAEQYGIGYRFANAATSYLAYLKNTIWPSDLIFFYSHDRDLPAGLVIAAALALAAGTGLAIHQIRQRPWLFAGWFWFLGTLVPVIGILQVGDQARGDRYTYIALIGVFWIFAWLGDGIAETGGRKRQAVTVLAGVTLLSCYIAAWRQAAHWRNSETLFTRALKVEPGNVIALNNLAFLHFQREEFDRSLELYHRLVEVDPENDRAHFNLADIYDRTNQPELAARHWAKLVDLMPGEAAGRMSLVKSQLNAGDLPGARDSATKSVIDFRNEPAMFAQLTKVLREQGEIDIESWCREVLAQDRRIFAAHACLLGELRYKRKARAALTAMQELLVTFPQTKEAHYHAALVETVFGKDRDALRNLETALQIDPGFSTARLELGRLVAASKDPAVHDPVRAQAIVDGAERALGRAIPQTSAIRAELAWRHGERAEALTALSAAIQLARQMDRDDLVPELARRLAEWEAAK